MLTFFSLLLVLIGSLNWLSIGVLQFDFVAGIFGSQANIFSRLIYTIIGIGAVVFTVLLIKNKGKVRFSLKKAQNDIQNMTAKPATVEADSDKAINQNNNREYKNSDDDKFIRPKFDKSLRDATFDNHSERYNYHDDLSKDDDYKYMDKVNPADEEKHHDDLDM